MSKDTTSKPIFWIIIIVVFFAVMVLFWWFTKLWFIPVGIILTAILSGGMALGIISRKAKRGDYQTQKGEA